MSEQTAVRGWGLVVGTWRTHGGETDIADGDNRIRTQTALTVLVGQ